MFGLSSTRLPRMRIGRQTAGHEPIANRADQVAVVRLILRDEDAGLFAAASRWTSPAPPARRATPPPISQARRLKLNWLDLPALLMERRSCGPSFRGQRQQASL